MITVLDARHKMAAMNEVGTLITSFMALLNRSWAAPNQGQTYLPEKQPFPNPAEDWMMEGVKPVEMTWWLLEAGNH